MKKNYLFTSERLGFRIWSHSDLIFYAEMNQNTNVMKYFPPRFRLNLEGSKDSMAGFMKHYEEFGFTYYAVDLLEENTFIGFIGMKTLSFEAYFTPAVDIGWRLREEYWGKGLATEGAKRCRDHFFDTLGYERLVSLTPVQNFPSWRVMEKIGMEKIGYFDHPMLSADDELLHHVVYEIKNQKRSYKDEQV